MPSGFQTPLDIAKRACQHLGVRKITSFGDTNSVAASELNLLYDKIRDRELERNIWRFSIKRAVLRPLTGSAFILTPPTWNVANNYSAGAIVAYQPITGTNFPTSVETTYWQTSSAVVASSGTQTPDLATNWHRFAGNIAGDVWRASNSTALQTGLQTNGYFTGELVIVPATYAGGTTYNLSDIVLDATDGNYYVSLVGSNVGHTPSASATQWQLYATWNTTQGNLYPNFVTGAAVYMSLTTANTQTPPGSQWLAMGGTVANLEVFYPIGTGPAWDLQTANVLRVPYGFERIAPAYLFKNDVAFLGADIGPYNDDWTIEGDFAITQYGNAVLMRFVGDMIDVYDMNAMFCEGVAAEMAWNACERVTGSAEKKADCEKAYALYMNEARLVNAIMEGMKKQPVCDYIAVRV